MTRPLYPTVKSLVENWIRTRGVATTAVEQFGFARAVAAAQAEVDAEIAESFKEPPVKYDPEIGALNSHCDCIAAAIRKGE